MSAVFSEDETRSKNFVSAIRKDDHASIMKIYEKDPDVLNRPLSFFNNQTPLMLVNSIETARFLLDLGADPDIGDLCDETILFHAIRQNKIELFDTVLEHTKNLNHQNNIGQTALHLLCCYKTDQHYTMFETLIRKGVSLDIEDAAERTPLYYAIEKENNFAVKTLVKNGCKTNFPANQKTHPLGSISENNDCEIVKILDQAHVDLDQFTGRIVYDEPFSMSKLTLLMLAAKNGQEDLVETLLDLDVDVNKRNEIGGTALHYAIQGNHISIVKKLIERHADPNLGVAMTENALDYAMQFQNHEIAHALLQHMDMNKIDFDKRHQNGNTLLDAVIMQGDLDLTADILGRMDDPNSLDNDKNSPLNQAFLMMDTRDPDADQIEKYHQMFTLLLQNGVNPNLQTDENPRHLSLTPLANAVSDGDLELTKLLRKHGAQFVPVADGKPGYLSFAITSGTHLSEKENEKTEAFVRYLVSEGITYNPKENSLGTTLICTAASYGLNNAIDDLVSIGADINDKCPQDESTPLIYALSENQYHTAKHLLERGADPNIENDTGTHPLEQAWAKEKFDLVDIMIDKGANPDQKIVKEEQVRSLVMDTILEQNADLLEKLLAHGANPNIGVMKRFAENAQIKAPLHMVVADKQDEKYLDMLLGCKNIDVEILCQDRLPPLYYALPNEKSFDKLVDAGASIQKLENILKDRTAGNPVDSLYYHTALEELQAHKKRRLQQAPPVPKPKRGFTP